MPKDAAAYNEEGEFEEDVATLLKQYSGGLSHYHEIHRQESLGKIRSRWPLLAEIGSNNMTKSPIP